MIIHNATFMTERSHEKEVITWLKERLADMESRGGLCGGWNPRISAMREAGGISHEEAEAASIAFQVEFEDSAAARLWSAREVTPLAAAFTSRFGVESMVFTSLFEVV